MTDLTIVENKPRTTRMASKRPFKRTLKRKPTTSPKTHKTTAKRKITRTQLIKKADTLASQYVRQFYAKDGVLKCYTCDHYAEIKKMQNGHWVVRQYKYVRWHLDNMRPQCYACNFLYNGRPHVFRERLVNEIGEERVKRVEKLATYLFTEKDDFIVRIIEDFKQKLASFAEKL